MLIARRIYLYIAAGLGLALAATGIQGLLSLAFEQIDVLRLGGQVLGGGPEVIREQVSLWLALTAVGLPIWMVHWWVIERSIARSGAEMERERRSTIRAFYFLVAMLVVLGVVTTSAVSLIELVTKALFPAAEPIGSSLPATMAGLLVAGAVLWYHGMLVARDQRVLPLERAAAWLPRSYRYIASLVGILVLVFGASDLIDLILRVATGRVDTFIESANGASWWVAPLASSVSRIVVGAAIWLSHWFVVAAAWVAAADWRGSSERGAAVRRGYLQLVTLIGATMTLFGLAASLEALLRWVLGVDESQGAVRLVEDVVGPPLSLVPFALAAWLHRRWALDEGGRFGGPIGFASADRIGTLLASLIGLAFASVGTARVLGLAFDLAFGGTTVTRPESFWRGEMSQFAAYAVVGASLWLWQWYRAQHRRAVDPSIEGISDARRGYLFLVLAASLVSGLTSLAFILYRLLGAVMGVRPSESLASDISAAVGVVVVAGVLFAYHGLELRADQRLGRPPVPGLAPARPDAAPPVAIVGPTMTLVLHGPVGADLAAILPELRRGLPNGFDLSNPEPEVAS